MTACCDDRAPVPSPQWRSDSRYSDRPMDWRTRGLGMASTATVFLAMAVAAFFTWRTVYPIVTAPAPLVVEMLPLAAPPDPAQEVPEGPQQVERKERKPTEPEDRPAPPEIVVPWASPIILPSLPPVEQVEAADPVPETTAPKSLPAPPASRASSQAQVTWEALLLAHLERYRRYPVTARTRREQGVVYVAFRMNRVGAVLSASIARSSGSAILDRAALDTVHRADPLPAIPEDRIGETIDLVVPVEFFVKGRGMAG